PSRLRPGSGPVRWSRRATPWSPTGQKYSQTSRSSTAYRRWWKTKRWQLPGRCCPWGRTSSIHTGAPQPTWTDPEGGQAGGPADGAAHEVRPVHQPQDRQGPRPKDPAIPPAAGRSGDRVTPGTWLVTC